MDRPRYPGLEIDENLRQQRIEWRVQRIAWWLLSLLLVAVVLGLIGSGPFSHARVAQPDGAVQLKYNRFLRIDSPDRLEVRVPASSGRVRVALAGGYVEDIEIEKVAPEPETARVESGAVVFVFDFESAQPATVEFELRPRKAGLVDGWVAVADGARLDFRQFVYP